MRRAGVPASFCARLAGSSFSSFYYCPASLPSESLLYLPASLGLSAFLWAPPPASWGGSGREISKMHLLLSIPQIRARKGAHRGSGRRGRPAARPGTAR